MIKEFLALLKDRRSRTVLIAPPLMQLLVFGYAVAQLLVAIGDLLACRDAGEDPSIALHGLGLEARAYRL